MNGAQATRKRSTMLLVLAILTFACSFLRASPAQEPTKSFVVVEVVRAVELSRVHRARGAAPPRVMSDESPSPGNRWIHAFFKLQAPADGASLRSGDILLHYAGKSYPAVAVGEEAFVEFFEGFAVGIAIKQRNSHNETQDELWVMNVGNGPYIFFQKRGPFEIGLVFEVPLGGGQLELQIGGGSRTPVAIAPPR